jgi:PAS domain S-box-containing protein
MSCRLGRFNGRWGTQLAAWALLILPALAADHPTAWLYRAWQTDDGLPNNDVTAIAQADDGAMLFATHSGLARFDGLLLQNVPTGEAGPSPRGVSGMCLGQDGTLWLISGGRLVALRKNQPPHALLFSSAPPDPRVYTMLEYPRGVLWICFEDRPVLRIDLAAAEAAGTVTSPVLEGSGKRPALARDSADNIWVAGPGALTRWTGKNFETVAPLPQEKVSLCAARAGGLWLGVGRQLLRYTATGCVEVACLPAGPAGSRAAALLEDRQGRVWFGTSGDGLYVWEGAQFTRVDLPNHDIWSLQEDREGNLWAGTGGGGVCRIRPRMLTMLEEPGGPVAQTSRSICADAHGDIWVALQTGKLFRRHAGSWQRLADLHDWPAAFASTVAADTNGTCWIGTSEGELVRWDGQSFEKIPLPPPAEHEGRIRALFAARDGEVWIGRGHALLRGQPGHWQVLAQQADSGEVRVIAQDSRDQIWVGTRDGVLLQPAGTNLVRCTPPELAGGGQIRALLGTPDGALWIGTIGGLARLKDGQCRLLTTAQGLRHNVVSQLILGPHGRLWAAGNRGIFFAALDELNAVAEGRAATFQCIAFGSSEGTPGLQANSGYAPNVLRAPDGRLWFATRSGLALADPVSCGANTVPPPVAIAEMSVDGKAVALPQPQAVSVAPGAKAIRFTLSAMSFVAPENVRLRYLLDDADTAWQDTPPDRTVTYSHLPPGDYTLRVRAANNDGLWSTSDALLAFTVQPFFYQRVVLRFAVATTGLAAVLVATFLAILRRRAIIAERRALAALRASEEKFAFAFHNSPIAMAITSVEGGVYQEVNAVFLSDSGYVREEVIGRSSRELGLFVDDLDRQRIVEAIGQGQPVYGMPCTFRVKDGSLRQTLVSSSAISAGGQEFYLSIILDITERKRVEEELQRSKEDWESIFQAIGQPTAILDAHYNIIAANRSLLQASGKTLDELRHLKCWQVFHAANATGPESDCPMGKALRSGQQEVAEIEVEVLGGTYLISCTPVLDAAGKVEKVIHIATNITEFKRLEQAFLQAQKMETVGKLAGGVAHDFNNILQTILGYSEFLLKNTPDSDERRRDLLEIQRSGERAATLTRQLLAFSRKQMLMPRDHDLNDIVVNLAKMLSRVLGENVRLKLELVPDLQRVHVDAGQIDQVLLNLAINARDAMPQGGQLSIRTANVRLDINDLPLHPEGRAGSFACLSVTDNGSGMSREVRVHIFEPFFTTKEQGKGTGLGLSTVYGVVKQHDGWVTVYSEPGHGTTFRIYLPAVDAASATSTVATAEPAPLAMGHGERILLIEDDPLVRRMTQQMLNQSGYRAIAVASCGEARAAFNSLLDLVLSDVMLPDGNGLDLVRQFQMQRPDLHCILTSGYADIHERWPEIEQNRWPFLIKPYNQSDLLRAIVTALVGI